MFMKIILEKAADNVSLIVKGPFEFLWFSWKNFFKNRRTCQICGNGNPRHFCVQFGQIDVQIWRFNHAYRVQNRVFAATDLTKIHLSAFVSRIYSDNPELDR